MTSINLLGQKTDGQVLRFGKSSKRNGKISRDFKTNRELLPYQMKEQCLTRCETDALKHGRGDEVFTESVLVHMEGCESCTDLFSRQCLRPHEFDQVIDHFCGRKMRSGFEQTMLHLAKCPQCMEMLQLKSRYPLPTLAESAFEADQGRYESAVRLHNRMIQEFYPGSCDREQIEM